MRVSHSSNGGLENLERNLGQIGAGLWKPVVSQVLAGEVADASRDDFAAGRAPDGSKWKPTKKGGHPLVETGALGSSISAKPLAGGKAGAEIRNTDYKAAFHQGTRPMIPSGKMPASWASRVDEACRGALRRLLEVGT